MAVFFYKRCIVKCPCERLLDRYEAIRKNAFCVFIEMIIAIIYHSNKANKNISAPSVFLGRVSVCLFLLWCISRSTLLIKRVREMICDIFLYVSYRLNNKKAISEERDGGAGKVQYLRVASLFCAKRILFLYYYFHLLFLQSIVEYLQAVCFECNRDSNGS